MKNYSAWLDRFFRSWQLLEGENTVSLFSNDVLYFETPLGNPCKSIDDVKELWAFVPTNQKNITYTYEIVCQSNDVCIVNWKMKRMINNKNQLIDGIFQISLNDDQLCDYFKQWRYTENV